MRTILLTGGAGYVGSLLTGTLLKRGDRVICLDDLFFGGDAVLPYLTDDRYRFHKVNICDRERIAPFFGGVDHVVHLAAIVGDAACREMGAATAWRNNVEAAQHVFELAEAGGAKRFIFPSAYDPYGGPGDNGPVVKAALPVSQSLYVQTKLAAERYLLQRGRESKCAPVVLRLAHLFGISPRTCFDLILNRLVLDATAGRRLAIDRSGRAYPFVHVQDAVRAIVLAIDVADTAVRNQILRVSGAGTYTVRELIEMIRPLIPDLSVESTDLPPYERVQVPGVSLETLASPPGFQASISVPEGIREVHEAVASGLIGEPLSPRHRSASLANMAPRLSSEAKGDPMATPTRIEALRAGPLVSIITPSFNQGRFIEETILSVLNQDYPHIEYLVIDGGSTDNTLEILKRYEGQLTWISEPDLGQSNAINKGFRMAKGEILAWLNSDDTYLPGAIRHAVTYLMKHPEAMMVYGEGYQIDEMGRVKGRFPYTEPFDLWKLVYVSDYILQQTAFFRCKIFDSIDMLDETLHWGMDWDLWIRIGKKFSVGYIPEYLANLRQYPEAKTYSGGIKRFRELVSLMRRHGTRRYPPAYMLYGLETAWKSLKARAQRVLPHSLYSAGILSRLASPLLAQIVGKIVFHAQGYYNGGWVWRKAYFLLQNPGGSHLLRLSGSVPDADRDPPPRTIRVRVNGHLLPPVTVSSSSFSETLELPEDVRQLEVVEVTLCSNWSIPNPMKGSQGMPGRVSFRLARLEVV